MCRGCCYGAVSRRKPKHICWPEGSCTSHLVVPGCCTASFQPHHTPPFAAQTATYARAPSERWRGRRQPRQTPTERCQLPLRAHAAPRSGYTPLFCGRKAATQLVTCSFAGLGASLLRHSLTKGERKSINSKGYRLSSWEDKQRGHNATSRRCKINLWGTTQ